MLYIRRLNWAVMWAQFVRLHRLPKTLDDHFLMYDHVLGAEHAGREPALWGPYTEKDPFHELSFFAYLAGITRRLEFMTASSCYRSVRLLVSNKWQTSIFRRSASAWRRCWLELRSSMRWKSVSTLRAAANAKSSRLS